MAIYHCHFNIGRAGKGEPHAQYIKREGKYKKCTKNERLVYKENSNMPGWAKDNVDLFWKSADEYERGGEVLSGRAYREIEIALPNELSVEENIALTKEFVKEQLGENFPYTFAIHYKKAALEGTQEQPHAHIMFSERKLDGIERTKEQFFKRANTKNPELGGNKKDSIWTKTNHLEKVRKDFEILQNHYLEKNGYEIKVDCRSHIQIKLEALEKGDIEKAKKFDVEPQKHLGVKVVQKVKKALSNYIRNANTNEEKELLTEKYFTDVEKNDRVKYVYFNKKINSLQKQLELAYQQLAHKSKQINNEQVLSVKDVCNIVDKQIQKEEIRANNIFENYLLAKKEVLSEERAEAIAISKVTNGQYYKIKKELNNNRLKIEKWNEKLIEFNLKVKPTAFELDKRKQYDLEKANLIKEKNTLLDLKSKLEKDKKEFDDKLSKSENKRYIGVLKAKVLEANLPKKEYANKLYKEYMRTKHEIENLRKQKNILAREPINKTIPFTKTNTTESIKKSMKKITDTINKDAYGQGLTARLHDEELGRG